MTPRQTALYSLISATGRELESVINEKVARNPPAAR